MSQPPTDRRAPDIVTASPRLLWAIAVLVTVLTFVIGQVAQAAPPSIPSQATARAELDALPVAAEGTLTGYSRDLFPHRITISGTCSARETVLKRDGSGVTVGADCNPISGSWFSQYDGVTVTGASNVDIDHVVPLAEAWRSGASGWSTSPRQSFANDLAHPQLIAVSASSNRSKGDQDPSTWKPRASYVLEDVDPVEVHVEPAPAGHREVGVAGHAERLLSHHQPRRRRTERRARRRPGSSWIAADPSASELA